MNAIRALDPHNAEATELLAGSARRFQMTLMFCDIVGSTAMADGRDPEEISDILRDYHRTCTAVVERFGGFVEDRQGDGMLVRFGYPEVHEDDARRAVLSGLEMIRVIRDRAQRLGVDDDLALPLRVAVHTDLVVLDGDSVAGATANEAARLQSLAAPDTVVVSDTTHALVQGYFDLASMGQVELRGVSRPVEVFTVLGERDSGCFPAGTPLSPFAGRQPERRRIAAVWQAALRGPAPGAAEPGSATARALLVTGEAGVGKSRLVLEAARATGAPCTECRCSRYHETTSLYAFRPVLEAACHIVEGDGADARLRKLRARLGALDVHGADLPFLTAALQIPPSAIAPPPDMDPSRLRELALGAAARLVHAHLGAGPSLLFVDDLHWADQSTVDLISALLSAPRQGLLVVLAARDGFHPPWPESVLERMQLAPLTGPELEEMARLMPEAPRLSVEQREELIARCDGMPLFLEELVRTAEAIDRGHALYRSIRHADFRIPAALRDPLFARLTSPGVDLELAQVASTIGRDVDRDLLRRVAGLPQGRFERKLQTLIETGLVDTDGERAVRFRHELIREVAYETQRRAARREHHGRIADELLQEGVASAQSDAGEAAFHLGRAQRYPEAIEAHVGAARSDQELGAHTEATRELTQALDLLVHLPEGAQRERTELMVRELRSFSAVMARGYAAPEAAEDHQRCVELCEGFGLPPELLPSLIRSWSFYAFRGELVDAERVCEAMERVVDSGGLSFPAEAIGEGLTAFFRGCFGKARRLMEAFVEHPWGRTAGRPPAEWPLPNDPLAAVCGHLVPILWICGERRAAYAMGERALRRAKDLSFPYGPFTVAYVNSLLSVTRRMEGDDEGAAACTERMIEVAQRHGFAFFTLTGMVHRGIGRVHAGEDRALDELHASVETWRRVVIGEAYSPWALTGMAEAQAAAGRREDALRSLDQALTLAAKTGSDFYSAETLRIRGDLRARAGDAGGVADIEAALHKARRQEARPFELRAAISLVRATEGAPGARAALRRAIGGISPDAGYEELHEAHALAGL